MTFALRQLLCRHLSDTCNLVNRSFDPEQVDSFQQTTLFYQCNWLKFSLIQLLQNTKALDEIYTWSIYLQLFDIDVDTPSQIFFWANIFSWQTCWLEAYSHFDWNFSLCLICKCDIVKAFQSNEFKWNCITPLKNVLQRTL